MRLNNLFKKHKEGIQISETDIITMYIPFELDFERDLILKLYEERRLERWLDMDQILVTDDDNDTSYGFKFSFHKDKLTTFVHCFFDIGITYGILVGRAN